MPHAGLDCIKGMNATMVLCRTQIRYLDASLAIFAAKRVIEDQRGFTSNPQKNVLSI